MSLSERISTTCKRNSETEGSSVKRMRVDDDSEVLLSSARTGSSSLAYSVSDYEGFSAALSDEDNHRSSSIISSGCSSEIVTDTHLPFLDLEVHQISETEISTLNINNPRKQASPLNEFLGEIAEMKSAATEMKDQRKPEKTEKSPTEAELDDFFTAVEKVEQKRFAEKYNYDIVNDKPLEGRYQWVSLKP